MHLAVETSILISKFKEILIENARKKEFPSTNQINLH